MSPAEVYQHFRHGFPERARVALVEAARAADVAARDLVSKYELHQARDALPYVRRADFESRVSQITVEGIEVKSRLNSRKTSAYVELASPTVSVTSLTRKRSPGRLPEALYRRTRAKASQLSLFGSRDEHDDVHRLYAVFIYGGSKRDLSMARVYFPIPDMPLRTVPPLDLLREWGEMGTNVHEKVRPTEAAAKLAFGLKRRAKEGGE